MIDGGEKLVRVLEARNIAAKRRNPETPNCSFFLFKPTPKIKVEMFAFADMPKDNILIMRTHCLVGTCIHVAAMPLAPARDVVTINDHMFPGIPVQSTCVGPPLIKFKDDGAKAEDGVTIVNGRRCSYRLAAKEKDLPSFKELLGPDFSNCSSLEFVAAWFNPCGSSKK